MLFDDKKQTGSNLGSSWHYITIKSKVTLLSDGFSFLSFVTHLHPYVKKFRSQFPGVEVRKSTAQDHMCESTICKELVS